MCPLASPPGTAALAVSPRARLTTGRPAVPCYVLQLCNSSDITTKSRTKTRSHGPTQPPPDSSLRTNMIPVLRFTARQPPPTTPPPANPAGASGWTANAPRRLRCHRRPSVDGARRGTTSRAGRRLPLQSRRVSKRTRHVERKMWANKQQMIVNRTGRKVNIYRTKQTHSMLFSDVTNISRVLTCRSCACRRIQPPPPRLVPAAGQEGRH